MRSRIFCSWLAVAALNVVGTLAVAEPLSQQDQLKRLAVLGPDFIVGPIEPPVIANSYEWINRIPGNYVYQVVSDTESEASTQNEQHVLLAEESANSWQRVIEERLVETFIAEADKDIYIVSETDHKHGFRIEMKPGIHLPRQMTVGHEWAIDAAFTAYRIENDERMGKGKITATHTYEGAYRVRSPAGEFDAILLREDFQIDIGPLKADDDRLLLLAKGVGLVAEVEGIKASALFVYHTHEASAKMLADYPRRE